MQGIDKGYVDAQGVSMKEANEWLKNMSKASKPRSFPPFDYLLALAFLLVVIVVCVGVQ